MCLFARFLLVLMLFFQTNLVLSSSYRKIDYTVEIRNICENYIKNLNIQYDDKDLFPVGGARDLGSYSINIFTMPMIIPDKARVTWRDSEGIQYKEQIPLRSLIRLWDYFGGEFKINFQVCNSELYVFSGKRKKGNIEYDLKEIWNNQDKSILSDKAA